MSQSKIVQIGDTHGEAEKVIEDIRDRYDPGDVDGFAFMGDATNMPSRYQQEAGLSEILSNVTSETVLDEEYGHFDKLGEEFGVPVYALPGNHEDEQMYRKIVDSYDNVEDVSYSSFEIGDHNFVGFGAHESREKPIGGFESDIEDVDEEEILEETYEEASSATPSDLVTGPTSAMGTMVGSLLGFGGSNETNTTEDTEETEESYDDDGVEDTQQPEEDPRKQIYEEKYDRIDELLTEADDNAVLMHHSVPDAAEIEGSEMGYVNDRVGYQGSVIGTEMIEKHNPSLYLGGHHHGQENEDILGTDVFNPGAGNYNEITLEEDNVADSQHYETDAWKPDYAAQADRVSDKVDDRLRHTIENLPPQILEDLPQELRDQIESGEMNTREIFEEVQRQVMEMAQQRQQTQ